MTFDQNYEMHKRTSKMKVNLANKKNNLRKMGLEPTVEITDIELGDTCPVTGLAIKYFGGSVRNTSPTLAIRDQELGWVPGNVFVVRGDALNKSNEQKLLEWRGEKRGSMYHGPVIADRVREILGRVRGEMRTRGIRVTDEYESIVPVSVCPVTGKEINYSTERTDTSATLVVRSRILGWVPGNMFIVARCAESGDFRMALEAWRKAG